MGVSEQGLKHSRHRFHVVPRTLIFITCRNRVLLLKGAPTKKIWPNRYNGVGGHIEPGETPLAAARRETAEEVGLHKLTDWMLCGTVVIETEDPLLGILLFVYRAVSQVEQVRGSAEGVPYWVHWGTLSPATMVPDLPYLLPRVLSMSAGDSPFYARTFYDQSNQPRIVFDD